jgi:uncharacterized protein YegL
MKTPKLTPNELFPGLPGAMWMPPIPPVVPAPSHPTLPGVSGPIGGVLSVQPPAPKSVEDHPLYKRVTEALTTVPKKRKGKGAKAKKRTHIVFVLDSSGSMQQGKEITVGGYNDQVEIMQEQHDQAGETTVSLVLFNGNVETSYAYAEPEKLQKLTSSTYRPNGNTALFDAMGRAIDLLLGAKGFADPETAFFVAVFTDGEENASRECYGELISKCIAKLEGTGRATFSFMGPKEGLASMADVLKIAPGNIAGYDASTVKGRSDAFASLSSATASYLCARSLGDTAVNNLYSGKDGSSREPRAKTPKS